MTDLISTQQAADILNCTQRWVNDLITAGKLKAQKVGTYYAIDKKSVIAYKQRQASDKPSSGQQ